MFAQVGIALPHYTVSQWNYPGAIPVPKSQLQPGDLVFFNGLDHVGIYIGYGDFIDAPHTGADVQIDSLGERGSPPSTTAPGESSAPRSARSTTADDGVHLGATHAFSSDVVYFTH